MPPAYLPPSIIATVKAIILSCSYFAIPFKKKEEEEEEEKIWPIGLDGCFVHSFFASSLNSFWVALYWSENEAFNYIAVSFLLLILSFTVVTWISNYKIYWFLEQEGAFAQLKVWQSASIAVVFFIYPYISLEAMLIIMLTGIFVSLVGFLFLTLLVEKAFYFSSSWCLESCYSLNIAAKIMSYSCVAVLYLSTCKIGPITNLVSVKCSSYRL